MHCPTNTALVLAPLISVGLQTKWLSWSTLLFPLQVLWASTSFFSCSGMCTLCIIENNQALTNVHLYFCSACLISETTQATKSSACGVPRINFFLYLRLAVIMGITWITGLVAGFVDMEPLWYVFVVLNTLQGFVIFVAFTCTRKVWVGVKETLCGVSESGQAGSSGSRSLNKWSRDLSSQATKKSQLDLSPSPGQEGESPNMIPSRYGPRSTTMYTVSKQQVSGLTQHSFDGRYY